MQDQEKCFRPKLQADIGLSSRLATLKEHYTNLASAYERRGMEREAALFTNVVNELQTIEDCLPGSITDEHFLSVN